MADEAASSAGAEQEAVISIPPVVVQYCKVCTFPYEYCEWGGDFEKCRADHPAFYESSGASSSSGAASSSSGVAQQLSGLSIDGVPVEGAGKEPAVAEPAAESKSKKKKGAKEPEVVIQVTARTKKKSCTIITGLELFGMKLEDAAKTLKKRFSCGAGVTHDDVKKTDSIEMQGDFSYEAPIFVRDTFKVPKTSIFIIYEGSKEKVPM